MEVKPLIRKKADREETHVHGYPMNVSIHVELLLAIKADEMANRVNVRDGFPFLSTATLFRGFFTKCHVCLCQGRERI